MGTNLCSTVKDSAECSGGDVGDTSISMTSTGKTTNVTKTAAPTPKAKEEKDDKTGNTTNVTKTVAPTPKANETKDDTKEDTKDDKTSGGTTAASFVAFSLSAFLSLSMCFRLV